MKIKKKQTTIFEIFHIFLPILLPSLKLSRGLFKKTTFFYSCQLIFLPCSVPIIWMIILIWFVLVTGYWLVVVSLSSPWQQVGGWERREERVKGQSLGRQRRRETYWELREKMQESSVSKTTVTVNGIMEYWNITILIVKLAQLILSIREEISWKQVEV